MPCIYKSCTLYYLVISSSSSSSSSSSPENKVENLWGFVNSPWFCVAAEFKLKFLEGLDSETLRFFETSGSWSLFQNATTAQEGLSVVDLVYASDRNKFRADLINNVNVPWQRESPVHTARCWWKWFKKNDSPMFSCTLCIQLEPKDPKNVKQFRCESFTTHIR